MTIKDLKKILRYNSFQHYVIEIGEEYVATLSEVEFFEDVDDDYLIQYVVGMIGTDGLVIHLY